jgi:hypothetical protein
MAAGALCRRRNHYHDFSGLLSFPDLFWIYGMRAKLCQGSGLVGNMAGLLGDPMGLGEVKKCGSNDKSMFDVMACRTKKYR